MKTKIPNDSHLLKEVSKKFIAVLKDRKVDESIIFDVHVAFEEALRNAMIHGNKMDPQKMVLVDAELENDRVVICVEDEGEGFDHSGLPDPTLNENILRESGRGVYMMNHLMDSVVYESGGKRVVMVKYLKPKRER
jgi:serine/threonine-protein kinase RsbW